MACNHWEAGAGLHLAEGCTKRQNKTDRDLLWRKLKTWEEVSISLDAVHHNLKLDMAPHIPAWLSSKTTRNR